MAPEEIYCAIGMSDLSQAAKDKLYIWQARGLRHAVTKPSWDEVFLRLAEGIKTRSSDSQTRVGAIIVNSANHIVAAGYNGFVAGIEDELLPNYRTDEYKDKYDWVIHAEENAILNCEHRPVGCTLYVTAHPCLSCLLRIAQAGIVRVVYNQNNVVNMLSGDEVAAKLEIAKYVLRNKVKVEGQCLN